MTPEWIEALENLATDAARWGGWNTVAVEASNLLALLALAKAATPSGQVAEDEAKIMRFLEQPRMVLEGEMGALSRLAAQAQEAEALRREFASVRGQVASLHLKQDALEAKLKDAEKAATRAVETLGGQPGENLQHCAERVRHEWERTAEEAKQWTGAGLLWDATRKTLEERIARLSAAGQILSEHADRAQDWTMRDEFAKAAMQGMLAAGRDASYSAIVFAAYEVAAKMMAERAKP